MLGTGNFLKSQKTISFKKNQSVLIAKFKAVQQNTKNRQSAKNKLPQKFRATRYINITSEIKEMYNSYVILNRTCKCGPDE